MLDRKIVSIQERGGEEGNGSQALFKGDKKRGFSWGPNEKAERDRRPADTVPAIMVSSCGRGKYMKRIRLLTL